MRNVNGSGCVFRRRAIIDAGGWQSDTLVEDTDLSYRMQLHNWEIIYDSDVVIPGEVPFNILIFKKQQYRWAKGLIQTFIKLIGPIWQSNKRLTQKLAATAHLSMYSGGFLILLVYLLTLPLIMIKGRLPAQLAIFGFSSFIPPISILVSQIRLRRNWLEGILLYPILSLISIGISLELTRAFWEAVTGKATPFNRTPKVSLKEGSIENYSIDLDWTTLGELILSLYGISAAILVFHKFPAAVPLFIIYSLAFTMNAFSEVVYALRKRARIYQVA
jgi:cellulose synthase/poly-beta-1,6-N-acetylglucosamine synthase-like glycosyltransferase